MAKIVTLGEIMLRLSPEGNDRFIQTDSFRIIPGGGEANVAISVANYGHDAYFVSKLPKHEIGQIAVNALRRYGVNTQFIARGGDRVGLYYAETGASMRPSKVIYDRAHSAIAEADSSDFDFDAIMEGAQWFHWSGITPAISDKAAELTRLACEAAKRHGVTVSVDLNFRKKLWTSEKAISIMRPLMKYVDVCIGNEEDAQLCLGFKPDADVEGGQTDAAGYEGIFKQMNDGVAPQTGRVPFIENFVMTAIKPRETMLRFSESRLVLADDPRAKLPALFQYYVERNFATREYQEQILERGVRGWLREAKLAERFHAGRVGNDEYHAQFPFVAGPDDKPEKIIKPLNLAHADAAHIIDHGGQWIVRINALKKRGLLPAKVLQRCRHPNTGAVW